MNIGDEPLQVNESPLPDQLWAGVRQVAPALVAFALGKGWLDNDMAALLAVVGGVAWPIIAGQLKVRRRAQQLAHVTARADDSVAVLK